MHRYIELRPDQLKAALHERPLAILSWGALEWHGAHLPLGLDGIVAERFAERLAERTGGVLLPTYYLPITTLPHRYSLQTRAEVVSAVWEELLRQLQQVGFRAVALLSGHYAHAHEILLTRAADAALERGLPVLSGPPLSIFDDPQLLDHAARWETSQLLALRPDLVDLGQLDLAQQADSSTSSGQDLAAYAVLGADPRQHSTPAEGEEIMARALAEWERWLERLLADEGLAALHARNKTRIAAYDSFVERFYDGSWEDALKRWWKERTDRIETSESQPDPSGL